MGVTLTREIRFGLEETPAPGAVNGFAGNPALTGIAPFVRLAVVIRGEADAVTGMLVNIQDVDRLLREVAVPRLREGHFQRRETAEEAVGALWELLCGRFGRGELAELRLRPSDYLTFAVCEKEPAMVRMSVRFEFSAAHRLHAAELSPDANVSIFGRCHNANGHGHNYELEVVVSGKPDAQGRVIALGQLQAIVNREVVDRFDHKHLNLDCAEFGTGGLNPTVENIAQVIFQRLQGQVGPAQLAAVRLWETPKTMCEYSA
jgi:6-pyruvoyltetrahydropterin/6-carboxytetrahydropterin synthase